MITKIKAKRVKRITVGGKQAAATVVAFEKFLALETIANISIKGRESSCLVLNKGKKFRLTFGFECTGIHDNPKESQMLAIAESVESGLKDISQGSVTFHLESFSEDADRQAELDRLIGHTNSVESKVLLFSEKKRSQELAGAGVRQIKRLTIYCDVVIDFGSPEAGSGQKIDWSEKAIAKLSKFWRSVKKTSQGEDSGREDFQELFEKGFNDGFVYWEQILSTRMGLDVKPLSAEELWHRVWQRFNRGKAPAVPQWVNYKDGDIEEVIESDRHPRSILTAGEQGESRVPVADYDWVKARDEFIGAMVFAEKPDGFVGLRHQLRFLWNALCQPYVRDTEIITQIHLTSLHIMRQRMQDVIKQSTARSEFAKEKVSVDVNANLRRKKSIQAQEQMFEGTVPLRSATVFLVHRKTKSQLNDACLSLANCFPLPCRLIRERDVPWSYWLQTLPIVWDKLLKKPYDRTTTWLSNEMLGALPICKTKDIDSTGFELIADDGGTPLKIDFQNKLRNLAAGQPHTLKSRILNE